MTSSERRSDVSAFLDEYNEAFASIDGHRIAALLPSAYRDSAGRGSIHCLQSREELASFFQVSQTHIKGMATLAGDLTIHRSAPSAAASGLVTLCWKMLRGDGSLIREWRQSYNLGQV
jgi:hypothetical protein